MDLLVKDLDSKLQFMKDMSVDSDYDWQSCLLSNKLSGANLKV